MKRTSEGILFICLMAIMVTACNNESSTVSDATAKDTSAAMTQSMDYPYKIDKPDNWETGSQQNTANALKALKAWENKNYDESMQYFADSVHVRFDNYDKKIPNGELKAMFIQGDGNVKSHTIKMEDWESVVSKNKKDEYVTIWYRQYNEGNDGTKDSVDIINDVKMKNGKIIQLDEYKRKLH